MLHISQSDPLERNIRRRTALGIMAATDCARCEGLCCVALAFDRSEHFAFDKAAGVPCPHLGADHRCRVHDERAERGLGGCIRYDCGGAGARVVRSMGRSWRESQAAAHATFEAFRVERDVDEARTLLEAARRLDLPASHEDRRAGLATEVDRATQATWPDVAPRVAGFVRSLRRLPLVRLSPSSRRTPRG